MWHPVVDPLGGGGGSSFGAVCAAPWGSSAILPISWAYIKMMGAEGLRRATEVAMLNANYMRKRLEDHYAILYLGKNGRLRQEYTRAWSRWCDTFEGARSYGLKNAAAFRNRTSCNYSTVQFTLLV